MTTRMRLAIPLSMVLSVAHRRVRPRLPPSGPRTGAAFEEFFGGQDLTHAMLLAFAAGGPDGAPVPRCRLCDLPTQEFEPAPAALPNRILAAIERDFPAWQPADGVCCRCAEVYACREAP